MRIGVDLGGSHIAVGLVENDGTIIERVEKNWSFEDRQDIENNIEKSIIEISTNILNKHNYSFENIEMIGIGSPGTIMDGKILNASNLGIKIFDIKKAIEEKTGRKVLVKNDAKCAAICEKKFGNLKDFSDAVFLTLGTGIGGAVFLDNKLLEPKRFSGFEIGHMIIKKDGIQCTCGKKGCFERYASMKSFKDMFVKEFNLDKNKNWHSKDIFEIIDREKENPVIKNIIDEYVDNLITGLVNLIDIFEPQAICMGGGFVYYKELLLPIIKEILYKKDRNFNKGYIPEIVIAKTGNDAGVIGAAMQD